MEVPVSATVACNGRSRCPKSVETDQIDASYHSGVLELKIPKGKQSQAKRIEVKAG